MTKLILSIVTIVGLGSSLYAGGKLVEPPIVPPKQIISDTWSGGYIGLQAGYIKGYGDVTGNYYYSPADGVLEDRNNFLKETRYSPDGFIGGLYLGYNKKFANNFLLGIEAAANYTKIDEKKDFFTLKQKNDFALYLKAGSVINDTFMPYVLAGATWTKLEGRYNYKFINLTDSDTVAGWTVGAGLEYKISQNWHARLQYRYSDYKDADLQMKSGSDVYKFKVKDYHTHSVMAGISYHF